MYVLQKVMELGSLQVYVFGAVPPMGCCVKASVSALGRVTL